MNQAFHHHPEEFFKDVLALAPVAGNGAAQAGVVIDTLGYDSAVAHIAYSTNGTVTGGTISAKWQQTTDSTGATGLADITGASASVTLPAATSPNGAFRLPLDFTITQDRYIKLVVTAAPTGSSETDIISATASLFGADVLPAG